MKHNARCWTPLAAVLAIVMSLLSGCAMGSSEPRVGACPPVVEYDRAEQADMAAEIEALPEGAVLVRMLSDYAVLREQARAGR